MAKIERAWGWLGLLSRVVLGGLFVYAGVLKLRNPIHFKQAINAFKMGFPDHLTILATYAIPWTEVVAGALLVAGLWARSAALVVGTMLLAFVGAMASVIVRGIETKCACFGELEFPCEGPVGWCHLARNGVLFGLALVVLFGGAGSLALDRTKA
jgi:putative oxidoreductase